MDYKTRFSIARLLWSLRELPGRNSIEAQWLIDIPIGKLARRFLDEEKLHTTPLCELAKGLDLKINPDPKKRLRLPLIDLSSTPDGKVRVIRHVNFKTSAMVPPRQKELNELPPDRHVVQEDVITLTEEFFDEKREDDNGHIITLSYFKGRWPFPKPITPQIAPLEGKTRIRIEGTNFTENSTVLIGNRTANDVRMARGGKLLYATVPSGKVGDVDVRVNTPNKEDKIIPSGITYVSDVVETARAVVAAYIIHLEELKELAQNMRDNDTFTPDFRNMLEIEFQFANKLSYELVDNRAMATGTPLYTPAVEEVYIDNDELIQKLITEVNRAIG